MTTMAADKTYHCCTKRRRKSPNWSHLHSDLLESILKRLSLVDVLRFKAVCSSWFSVVETFISSPSYNGFLQTPWLMLPPVSPDYHQQEKHVDFRFFNLKEKREYEFKDIRMELGESRCVGSSHGWLVHLDQGSANPSLLNPFSRARIQLPPLKNFPSMVQFFELEDGSLCAQCKTGNIFKYYWYESKKHLSENFIAKAILSSDPVHSHNNCRAIVIYCQKSKLAFCNHGDLIWTDLDGNHQSYSDIIFYNDQLYALADDFSVEVYDFRKSFPVKKFDIKLYYLAKTIRVGQSLRDVCSTRLYLVELGGHVLIIVRFIGDLVNVDGQPVEEADLLGDESNHPLICPYKSLLFDVYKVDFDKKKMVEVESLGDRVLFLGGNHSLSLSARDVQGYKENSIYFTDDYWDRMNEDYLYGGHDMGVFNLEDKSIKPIYQCHSQKIEPPPFWVVPNSW